MVVSMFIPLNIKIPTKDISMTHKINVKKSISLNVSDEVQSVTFNTRQNKYTSSFKKFGTDDGRSSYLTKIGIKKMNADEMLVDFNPSEAWFYKLLQKNLKPDGSTYLPIKDMTSSEKQKVIRAYKSLRKKDVLRRTKKLHYQFNPAFLQPVTGSIELAEYYLSLK